MAQQPSFAPAPVLPPGQFIQAPQGGSGLAAAMARPGAPFTLPTPSAGIPLSSMMAMKEMMDRKVAAEQAPGTMPGQAVDPRTGMGTAPPGGDPYANMTAAELAGQARSNLPFGAIGSPSAAYNSLPPPQDIPAPPGWLARLFGSSG